jgi:hypothetical protein
MGVLPKGFIESLFAEGVYVLGEGGTADASQRPGEDWRVGRFRYWCYRST